MQQQINNIMQTKRNLLEKHTVTDFRQLPSAQLKEFYALSQKENALRVKYNYIKTLES